RDRWTRPPAATELWWTTRFTIHLEYGHVGAPGGPGGVPSSRGRLVPDPGRGRAVRARAVPLHQQLRQRTLRGRPAGARRDRGRVDHAALLRERDGVEGDRYVNPADHD